MKRFTSFLIVFVMLLTASSSSLITVAWEFESYDRLITVGGNTVQYDMTLDDVIELFGQPKLTTGSMFGGKACTFYGKNYSDYLYIETFEDGSIAAYGSVSPDFETDTLSFGDTADNIVRREYEAIDRNNKVFGLIRYRDFQTGLTDEYFANAVENNMNLCRHAVEMWNAVSYLHGYNTPTRFDEQTFYVSQQLADNYSDLHDYCFNTNQDSYFNSIGAGTLTWCGEYQYPNPLMFADGAIYYECPDEFPAAFIVRKTTDDRVWQSGGFVNPELFEDRKIVDYTAEEMELLENVRETYMKSVRFYNDGYDEGYYAVEPQYDSLPLVGGMLNEKVAIGAVDFLNAIRIGARLEPLEYSRELSESAQWKATLTRYITKQGNPNPNPHFPAKPDGVSDEFYQKTMLGSGENLFMCGFMSTSVIGSLQYALDDGYGNGEYYDRGHRYNLLDPNWVEIGVGNTEQQGCHKMSGYRDSDVEVVAWPSDGIMLAESMVAAKTMYTCRFYNGYRADDRTVVAVKCLNTGKTWRIAQGSLTSDQDFNTSGDLISYYDATIAFSVGNVYEITFEDLLNTSGKRVDYTYRSVYEKAYVNSETDVPMKLTLSESSLKLEKGASRKIKASVTPNTATNMMVKWSSSAPLVASVNENGIVTGKSSGSAVITAVTEDGQIKATCKVTVCSKHTWNGGVVTKNPTCEAEGSKTYTCTQCGGTKEETLSTNAHTYSSWSRYDAEEHWSRCDVCSRREYKFHEWNSGNVTRKPTTTSTGVMTYTCVDCGATRTETIPKLTSGGGSAVTSVPTTTGDRVTTAHTTVMIAPIPETSQSGLQPSTSIPQTASPLPEASVPTSEMSTRSTELSASVPETSEVPETSVYTPNETSSVAPSTDLPMTGESDKPITTAAFDVTDWTVEDESDDSSKTLYIVVGISVAVLTTMVIVFFLIKLNIRDKE